jgi:tripartite-type tricarboxylate transporter receptor subunit TctC
MRLKLFFSRLLCSLLLGLGAAAHAQAPSGSAAPLRILVGAPAGGTTDTMARTLAQALGQQLGRTVVVENKPGVGGNLAAEEALDFQVLASRIQSGSPSWLIHA